MYVLATEILSKAASSPRPEVPPGCTGAVATFGTGYHFATQKGLCDYGEIAVLQMNKQRIDTTYRFDTGFRFSAAARGWRGWHRQKGWA